MDRRQFLKHTWYSGILLSGSALTVSLAGCGDRPDLHSGFKVFRRGDLDFFRAILPTCLPTVLTPNADNKQSIAAANNHLTEEILVNYDHILSLVNPDAKKEFYQLMDLLNLRLTRGVLTGIWRSWATASASDIDRFLWRWRNGSITLLSVAYVSITTMLTMAAFQIPSLAAQLGYDGPPKDLLVAWQQ